MNEERDQSPDQQLDEPIMTQSSAATAVQQIKKQEERAEERQASKNQQ
jgi:hypothetical protein